MPEVEIRDNPKLRSLFRNITEFTFTGFVWGLWAYLLLPILNIVMWLAGLRFIEISVIEQLGYKEMIGLVSKMGWIVLSMFLVFRLWGFYNYKRFGKRSRRKNSHPVTLEQTAGHFQIPVEEVEHLQLQKEIVWENPGLPETSHQ